jgi:hypothetical protein
MEARSPIDRGLGEDRRRAASGSGRAGTPASPPSEMATLRCHRNDREVALAELAAIAVVILALPVI